MRRFTILSLMGVVLALALALAAVRGANAYWAGGLLLATPLAFGIATIGATCGHKRSRAGRLGFAILGGGYFALAFLGLSDENLAKLPTSILLDEVHQRVVGQLQFSVSFTSPGSAVTPGATGPFLLSNVGAMTTVTNVSATNAFFVSDPSAAATFNRWKSLFPGAANRADFLAVGHCLFALLAGLLGSVIARRFEKAPSLAVE